MTKEELQKAFLDDLRELLAKHHATLEIVDVSRDYYSQQICEVDIDAEYDDDGNTLRPWASFQIPRYFHKDSK